MQHFRHQGALGAALKNSPNPEWSDYTVEQFSTRHSIGSYLQYIQDCARLRYMQRNAVMRNAKKKNAIKSFHLKEIYYNVQSTNNLKSVFVGTTLCFFSPLENLGESGTVLLETLTVTFAFFCMQNQGAFITSRVLFFFPFT